MRFDERVHQLVCESTQVSVRVGRCAALLPPLSAVSSLQLVSLRDHLTSQTVPGPASNCVKVKLQGRYSFGCLLLPYFSLSVSLSLHLVLAALLGTQAPCESLEMNAGGLLVAQQVQLGDSWLMGTLLVCVWLIKGMHTHMHADSLYKGSLRSDSAAIIE